MMAKKKPTGFVARCQCGAIVGAMDYERTDRCEAGQILSKWLFDGCTIEPRFAGAWNAMIEACRCACSEGRSLLVDQLADKPSCYNRPPIVEQCTSRQFGYSWATPWNQGCPHWREGGNAHVCSTFIDKGGKAREWESCDGCNWK